MKQDSDEIELCEHCQSPFTDKNPCTHSDDNGTDLHELCHYKKMSAENTEMVKRMTVECYDCGDDKDAPCLSCRSVTTDGEREAFEKRYAVLDLRRTVFDSFQDYECGGTDILWGVWKEAVAYMQAARSSNGVLQLSPLNTLAPEKIDTECRFCGYLTKAGEHHAHPCSADSGHPDDAQMGEDELEPILFRTMSAWMSGTIEPVESGSKTMCGYMTRALLAVANITKKEGV
jgi:hypothetical protein